MKTLKPDFSGAIEINDISWITKIFGIIGIFIVPTLQRINYFFNMKLFENYGWFLWWHELLSPWVFATIACYGKYFFKPCVVFKNISEKEFEDDIKKNSSIIFSNHVSYADTIIGLQFAMHYGIVTRFVAFFMKELKRWLFIGPSLWGQLPMARDKSGKDVKLIEKRIKMFKDSKKSHLFMIFPEGVLRKQQSAYKRTIEKSDEYNLDLQYIHYPKTTGFLTLVDNMGDNLKNVYKMTLFYDAYRKQYGNKVYVIIEKVSTIKDLPQEPSSDFIKYHELEINDSNKKHFATEEFLLNHFLTMESELREYYSDIPEEDRPTIQNYHKWFEAGENLRNR